MSSTSDWSLYLVRCADGALYTGVAVDVARRLSEHREGRGRGAKYLRGRGPLALVFQSVVGDRAAALRLERRVKGLKKAQKQEIIDGTRSVASLLAAE